MVCNTLQEALHVLNCCCFWAFTFSINTYTKRKATVCCTTVTLPASLCSFQNSESYDRCAPTASLLRCYSTKQKQCVYRPQSVWSRMRTHQFKATRRVHPPPSASLPGLPSRTPPMLDALEEASGLDRDLGSSGAEQTTLGERGDGRQEQAGQGPPRRARRPGRQMSRRGNGAMLL